MTLTSQLLRMSEWTLYIYVNECGLYLSPELQIRVLKLLFCCSLQNPSPSAAILNLIPHEPFWQKNKNKTKREQKKNWNCFFTVNNNYILFTPNNVFIFSYIPSTRIRRQTILKYIIIIVIIIYSFSGDVEVLCSLEVAPGESVCALTILMSCWKAQSKKEAFSNQIRAHLVLEPPAAPGITSSFGIHW